MTVVFENQLPRKAPTLHALAVDELSIHDGTSSLVRTVSFTVAPGQITAIVGESGSGKSLTARAIMGLLPSGLTGSGHVRIGARRLDIQRDQTSFERMRGPEIVMLLQDPFTSLSPVHKIGRQIAWTLKSSLGQHINRSDLRARVQQSLSEMNLSARVATQYPHELSGGMRQRAAMAAALAASPAVLIADEPTTALDASTQAEVLDLIAELRLSRGMAVVLISHDLTLVRGHADNVVVMHAGSILESGPAEKVLETPAHPYTAGLKASTPRIGDKVARLPSTPWMDSDVVNLPAGTSFGPGYREATQARNDEPPVLVEIETGWHVGIFRNDSTPFPVQVEPAATGAALAGMSVSFASSHTWGSRPSHEARKAGTPLLQVNSLSKSFSGRTVLREIDLEVAVGASVGIVGESGSGKTTLARCIVGLERPDSGHVQFSAAPTGDSGQRQRAVQIVFQDPYSALNPALTVGHALREALRIGGRSPSEAAALLGLVGLGPGYLSRRPRELSGGQRQRVAIARALAPRPRLLLCDESVSALDVSIQAQILNLLADLRNELGLALLFISHDLAVINQISDQVHVLKEGRVVESGPTTSILHSPVHSYTRHLLAAARAGERNKDNT